MVKYNYMVNLTTSWTFGPSWRWRSQVQ